MRKEWEIMANKTITIRRLGRISYFELGTEMIEIKDYRIITQSDGKTKVEIQIECDTEFMELVSSPTKGGSEK